MKLNSPHFGRQYGLLGLVSRGLMTKLTDENGTEYKTCDVSKPSVFTNLSKYNEWISDQITLPALEQKYQNFINKFRKFIETEKLNNGVLHFNADLYIKNLEYSLGTITANLKSAIDNKDIKEIIADDIKEHEIFLSKFISLLNNLKKIDCAFIG